MEVFEIVSVDEVRLLYVLYYFVNDVDGQMIMIVLRVLNELNVDVSDFILDKCEVVIVELNIYTLKSAVEVIILLINF